MSATADRLVLMEMAARVQSELAVIREQLRPLSQLVANLIAAGDSLMIASADEIEKGEAKMVTPISLGKTDTSRSMTEAPALATAIISTKGIYVGKGKRACSLCREPGHRAQNCPNAHVIRERDKAQKEAPKPKRSRKPISEERKAQLRETLKKARAAKGKKK